MGRKKACLGRTPPGGSVKRSPGPRRPRASSNRTDRTLAGKAPLPSRLPHRPLHLGAQLLRRDLVGAVQIDVPRTVGPCYGLVAVLLHPVPQRGVGALQLVVGALVQGAGHRASGNRAHLQPIRVRDVDVVGIELLPSKENA